MLFESLFSGPQERLIIQIGPNVQSTATSRSLFTFGIVFVDFKSVTSPSRAFAVFYFTTADGIFGLLGFTVMVCPEGETTRSVSSIGTAPISTDSPMTRAPVKHVRFA